MNEPLDLPEHPTGFTRRLTLHLNFGGGKGAGVFAIYDPSGKKMPFAYRYDTSKGGLTGFVLPDIEGKVFNWTQMREHYAAQKSSTSALKKESV